MKKRQQRFGVLQTLLQLWDEQVLKSIRYSYVPAGSAFKAMGNSSKTRPWFDR